LGAAELRDLSVQALHQTASLWHLDGALALGVLLDVGPFGRQLRRSQLLAGPFFKFTNPNLFERLVLFANVVGIPFPTRGLAQTTPPTDFVCGAGVLLEIDEGLTKAMRWLQRFGQSEDTRPSMSIIKRLIRLG
jgi:hypothetical protein